MKLERTKTAYSYDFQFFSSFSNDRVVIEMNITKGTEIARMKEKELTITKMVVNIDMEMENSLQKG